MITTICVIISILIGVYFIYKNRKTIALKNDQSKTPRLLIGILIIVGGIVAAFVQPFILQRVDAGHVGIKVNLTGDNRGVSEFEYKTGWVITNEWVNTLYEFPTYQQTIDYPEQTVISKGGFPATIHPKFNYSLNPGNIGDMFQNLRLPIKEIETGWLQTAIVGAVNDVANKWNVDDIFNHREQFEADITIEANKRISKWFKISQLRTNIVPPEALQKSIIAKTQAIQEVQVAENKKAVAIAEGETRVAQARADSAAAVIAASGEAEAIRRKQVSLNSQYIDYMKIQKWDGRLPQVQSGNAGILLSMNKE